MITLKQILLATDFSETAGVALKYAVALADAFDATVHVLHVLEDPLPGWKPEGHVASVPRIRDGMERDARDALDNLLLTAQGRAQATICWGRPFVEIIRYAKQNAIDLIVLGSHGHGPIQHLLIGNVAEKVVRHAPCPVLTLRHPEHDFVSL